MSIIDPDIEAGNHIKQGKAAIGIVVRGTGHRIISGEFYGLTTGIKLENAQYCLIDMPHFSNASLPEEMITAVLEDNQSKQNRVILAPSYNSVQKAYGRGN